MSAFPASPTNGQTVTVNGVLYTYNSTKTAWTVTSSGGSLTVGSASLVSSLTITGTVTCGGLTNSNANGVSNIGSSTGFFNTVFAKATSAQYADLAEAYRADAMYAPGTVLSFGGNAEVTLTTATNCCKIAGVVSTNPAYIMNGGLESENVAIIALTGRVPTAVVGTVHKGDMMVSAGNGQAMSCAAPTIGTVIGKAVEDYSGNSGIIEIVVGRM